MKPKILLVSGYARSGKDTFCKILSEMNNNFVIYAFAYELKRKIQPIIYEMGIDVFNPTNEQKKIIRNIMISYGCAWREIDINHWVKIVNDQIDDRAKCLIPIISDNRFISETEFFFNKYGRQNVILVEISRENMPTPPEEELKNQKLVSEIANEKIDWPTVEDGDLTKLRPIVEQFYQKYFN
jgi:hypothetical protein